MKEHEVKTKEISTKNGLRLVIMYQHWFINCNSYNILKLDVKSRGNQVWDIWELHCFYSYSVNLKLSLKNKVYFQKQTKGHMDAFSYIASGNAKYYSHFEKQFDHFL